MNTSTSRSSHYSLRRRVILCAAVALLAPAAGCRFKSPTAAEGQHLVDQKVFSTSVPAWVNQSESERPAFATNSGLVPQAYTVPNAIQTSRAAINSPLAETADALPVDEEPARADLADEEGTVNRDQDAQDSPLDRIETSCPGTEAAVSDALRTEASGARIKKYEDLTRKCPTSADLWLWLGKDYQTDGRLAEANRAFEQVLINDPDNEAARALLSVVRRRLNAPEAGN